MIFLNFFYVENVFAENFLGVPVMPQIKEIKTDETRMEMTTELSHDVVVNFYEGVLKKFPSIKYRDWKNATYIEDDGKLKWHSITISKREFPTSIVIVKDSWTWIFGTLVLRYISVFVVLGIIFIGMIITGNIIPQTVNRREGKDPGRHKNNDRPT